MSETVELLLNCCGIDLSHCSINVRQIIWVIIIWTFSDIVSVISSL